MDQQAKNELIKILKLAKVESINEVSEEIISVFNDYRRRSRAYTEERKKIESEIKTESVDSTLYHYRYC